MNQKYNHEYRWDVRLFPLVKNISNNSFVTKAVLNYGICSSLMG